jgi:hypothetical protein
MPETPSLGADELEIRDRLRKLEVGPDAGPTPVIPPKPTTRPRDWLDDVLDGNAAAPGPVSAPRKRPPAPAPKAPKAHTEPDPKKPLANPADEKDKTPARGAPRRRKRRRFTPSTPRSAWDSQPAPRQSLLDAWDNVPYRLKWLAIHLAGAAVGWKLGLVQWATNTAAWYAAGHWTSPSAWVLYVFAGLLASLYRVVRPRAWLFRLLAAIPIASAAVGLLLYGTDYMNLRIPW